MSNNIEQIGERTFSFGTLPAVEAIRVEVAIARVIGEPLFKAFMESRQADSDEAGTESAGATAIGLMMSRMDADELIDTMETLFKYVSVNGKRVDINADFTGKNKELWLVFIAALRFNFSDFLPEGLFSSLPSQLQK